MPTNVYRVQGPEGTIPYQQYLIEKNNDKLKEISTALTKDVRCDGRDILTHRNLCKILNIIYNKIFNRIFIKASRLVSLHRLKDQLM